MPPSESGQSVYEAIVGLRASGRACVLVALVEALGSTPQDTGAKMLVTEQGLLCGTVGGGRLEAKAIAHAQEMLAPQSIDSSSPKLVTWTLKGDVGMTCGGSVKLYFEPHPATGSTWPIAIFGAGHVVQALLPVLQPLPCSISVYDSRPEWLQKIDGASNVTVKHTEDLPAQIDSLPATTFLLSMTQGHRTDRPILFRALSTRSFSFVGCIGSDAKAAVLRQELIADGLPAERAQQFHCPVGLNFGTNHPHEIALSIAAQLLTERDRLAKSPKL